MAGKNSGYINLTIRERIRLLENNIRVFEENGAMTLAKRLRFQLSVLQKDLAAGTKRDRNW